MDDRHFDEQSALEWIAGVEGLGNALRDRDIYPRLAGWVERVNPKHIVDIGCGQGVCSDRIPLTHRRYLGIEPSSHLLARAKALYEKPDRSFVEGNAHSVPLPDGSSDAAFSIMVWHLLENIQSAAHEMSRVLRPAAAFLIIIPNPDAWGEWSSLYLEPKLQGIRLEGPMVIDGTRMSSDVLFRHSRDSIESAIAQAGLQIERWESFRPGTNGKHLFATIEGTKLH